MAAITGNLGNDIAIQVNEMYHGAERFPYSTAVRRIAGELNDYYQHSWQTRNRGLSFQDAVASTLVEIMYREKYHLSPEKKDPKTNKVIVPRVKYSRNTHPEFVKTHR